MGEWRIPPTYPVWLDDVVSSGAFGLSRVTARKLAVALHETGYLVATPYYVPDHDDLMAMYRDLGQIEYHARADNSSLHLRWVMCGETHQALYERYANTRVPWMPAWNAWISGDETVSVDAAFDDWSEFVTRRLEMSIPKALDAGSLFGLPIRRDPAARRPMWEFVPKEERKHG